MDSSYPSQKDQKPKARRLRPSSMLSSVTSTRDTQMATNRLMTTNWKKKLNDFFSARQESPTLDTLSTLEENYRAISFNTRKKQSLGERIVYIRQVLENLHKMNTVLASYFGKIMPLESLETLVLITNIHQGYQESDKPTLTAEVCQKILLVIEYLETLIFQDNYILKMGEYHDEELLTANISTLVELKRFLEDLVNIYLIRYKRSAVLYASDRKGQDIIDLAHSSLRYLSIQHQNKLESDARHIQETATRRAAEERHEDEKARRAAAKEIAEAKVLAEIQQSLIKKNSEIRATRLKIEKEIAEQDAAEAAANERRKAAEAEARREATETASRGKHKLRIASRVIDAVKQFKEAAPKRKSAERIQGFVRGVHQNKLLSRERSRVRKSDAKKESLIKSFSAAKFIQAGNAMKKRWGKIRNYLDKLQSEHKLKELLRILKFIKNNPDAPGIYQGGPITKDETVKIIGLLGYKLDRRTDNIEFNRKYGLLTRTIDSIRKRTLDELFLGQEDINTLKEILEHLRQNPDLSKINKTKLSRGVLTSLTILGFKDDTSELNKLQKPDPDFLDPEFIEYLITKWCQQ